MQNNDEYKERAQQRAKRLLDEAEEKRASNRFVRGIEELRNGRFEILKNTEFREKLGVHLYNEYTRGDSESIKPILDNLFNQFHENKYLDQILPLVGELCGLCQYGYNIRLMEYLSFQLVEELEKKDPTIIITENIQQFLAQACRNFVRSSQWQNFDALISTLWKVRHREYLTDDGKEAVFESIFAKIAAKDVIEKITQYHNTGNAERKKMATRCIRYLGEGGILYLLNRLVFSKSKQERFLLIRLLGGIGKDVLTPIRKFMEEDLPWYAVRNLIALVGELQEPDYYDIVENYLVHPDVRVQQQVVACIVKLGGQNLNKRLIQALPVVDDEIKTKLIMQLGSYHEEEIAGGLIDIIHKIDTFSAKIREELLHKTCITLRSYPYTKVLNILKHLLREKAAKGYGGERLRLAIQETIHILEPRIRHRAKQEEGESELVRFAGQAFEEEGDHGNIDDFIKEIDEMILQGNIEKASALMYKKIVELARSKDFQNAEMLRDKLLEENPDALQDVVRVAEIIEEERESPSAGMQYDIWESLIERLTNAEYEYFITCLQMERYARDERIVSIPHIDPCLYLLNSGSVRLSCKDGDREMFLKRLKPGEVVGIGPFFSASVWTVNMTALEDTVVLALIRDKFMEGLDNHPQLEEKLRDFCSEQDNIHELLRMSGRDRRENARYPANFSINNILLDYYGEKEGRRTFKGEVLDISRGGLSFSVRISNRKSAQRLLGRQIISEINLPNQNLLNCYGLIVGVKYQHELAKEFAIHVKFYSEIAQQQVNDILKAAG